MANNQNKYSSLASEVALETSSIMLSEEQYVAALPQLQNKSKNMINDRK